MGYAIDKEYLDLLYEPCQSKEELKQHAKTFINVDIPDVTVDEDSNSNPMELLWSVYHSMLTGKGARRIVVAASRNSMKSLMAAVIRFYGMIHFRRDGIHLAAISDQSSTLINYLDGFLGIDGVKEHLLVSNTKKKTLKQLPANSFTKKATCELRIAVATKSGVNSQRGSLNMRDETELIPKEIIKESSFVADPTRDQHRFPAITIDLSSRKIADGVMQEKIDEAEAPNPPEGLRLHKWSGVDFMKRCPPETHRPELGNVSAYLNTETLEVVWGDDQVESVPDSVKNLYKHINAYEGCRTCPAFVVCQARAPKQTGNSIALRSITDVGDLLEETGDPDYIIAQSLNWRPGRSGNVFKMLRKARHLRKPIEFYHWCAGEYFAPDGMDPDEAERLIGAGEAWKVTPTKADIFEMLNRDNWTITYGVDWGFSPAEATCIVTAFHRRTKRAAVLHVESAQHLANQDWANYIIDNIWSKYPGDYVCPDIGDRASPTYFSRRNIPSLDKKPMAIETGVSQLRSLLYDPIIQGERFCILDEGEGNKNLYTAMEKWTHRKSPLGFDFNKFDDNNYCDYIDPLRYALDPFILETRIGFSAKAAMDPHNRPAIAEAASRGDEEAMELIRRKNSELEQLNQLFFKETGVENLLTPKNRTEISDDQPTNGKSSKKSRIKFSF